MSDNKGHLAIWDEVKSTDPDYTKEYKGAGGFSGTSINSTYQVRKATELFGPIGIGWGYEIVSERIDTGHAIAGKDAEGKPVFNDGVASKLHTLHLRLWYMSDGKRATVDHFGHTPFVYVNKYGVQMEGEPAKKSLTDAIGKCLSMLGFSADIFLGDFEDQNYLEQVKTEFDIKKAEDQEAEVMSKREELTDYVTRHLESIERANTLPELNGIEKGANRHLARQEAITHLKQIAERGQRAITEKAEAKRKEINDETV